MAARRKPGAYLQDAERHTVKRTLRLTPAESAALDSVAEARGVNVSRAVGALAVEANQLHPWAAARVETRRGWLGEPPPRARRSTK
jgi:predicted nuclease with RNAse H fold